MGWAQEQGDSSPTALVIDVETAVGTDPILTDATLVYLLDFTNAAAGDVFVIKWHEKLTGTGDSQLSELLDEIVGAQNDPLWRSPSLFNMFGSKLTVEQTDGTGRVVGFSRRAVSA